MTEISGLLAIRVVAGGFMKSLAHVVLFYVFFGAFVHLFAQPVTPGEERYRIGYQDRIAIQVFRHPELSQTVEVNTNGTITLFRLNEPIVAVCKTERELADAIAEAYRKDYLRNQRRRC
ncbi:MAG: hypothetical protein C4325_09390 [Blastocatellia bacterium]